MVWELCRFLTTSHNTSARCQPPACLTSGFPIHMLKKVRWYQGKNAAGGSTVVLFSPSTEEASWRWQEHGRPWHRHMPKNLNRSTTGETWWLSTSISRLKTSLTPFPYCNCWCRKNQTIFSNRVIQACFALGEQISISFHEKYQSTNTGKSFQWYSRIWSFSQ